VASAERSLGVPISTNHVCVGDAKMTIDPLATQGIHLAMPSDLQAAAAVHTLLEHSQDGAYAISFDVERQRERRCLYFERIAEMHWQMAQGWSSLFWAERGKKRPEPVQPMSVVFSGSRRSDPAVSQERVSPIPILDNGRIRCGDQRSTTRTYRGLSPTYTGPSLPSC
jgi:hypothetical protein